MLKLSDYKEIYQNEFSEIQRDYFDFLRFPSIATDPAYNSHVEACATWLQQYLTKIGLHVERWETSGAPTIFASDMRAGPNCETLLLYCHYDVQPVDPLDLWTTPPFEPTLRNGKVYARGAVDNKGQCFYTIRALKTLLEKHKRLPVNIKFLIEGEEESGSTGLFHLLDEKKEELKADHILIVDSGLESPGQPAISLGARGLTCMTLTMTGSKFDLHSGTHGGIVYNPNRALVELLSTLHDHSGSVTVPGFYDDLTELSSQEKALFKLEFDKKQLKEQFEAEATGMEKGVSPREASWLRPTAEINGISGGYAGAGFKTVIPAKAFAKLSFRLVPSQDPQRIADAVKKFLISRVPPGMHLDVELHGSGRPFRTNPHSKLASIMSKAYSEVFQKPCERILLGGSIPVAADLAHVAQGEMVLVGVGLATDQIHAPDEHFDFERFEQGYLTLCLAIQSFTNKK